MYSLRWAPPTLPKVRPRAHPRPTQRVHSPHPMLIGVLDVRGPMSELSSRGYAAKVAARVSAGEPGSIPVDVVEPASPWSTPTKAKSRAPSDDCSSQGFALASTESIDKSGLTAEDAASSGGAAPGAVCAAPVAYRVEDSPFVSFRPFIKPDDDHDVGSEPPPHSGVGSPREPSPSIDGYDEAPTPPYPDAPPPQYPTTPAVNSEPTLPSEGAFPASSPIEPSALSADTAAVSADTAAVSADTSTATASSTTPPAAGAAAAMKSSGRVVAQAEAFSSCGACLEGGNVELREAALKWIKTFVSGLAGHTDSLIWEVSPRRVRTANPRYA